MFILSLETSPPSLPPGHYTSRNPTTPHPSVTQLHHSTTLYNTASAFPPLLHSIPSLSPSPHNTTHCLLYPYFSALLPIQYSTALSTIFLFLKCVSNLSLTQDVGCLVHDGASECHDEAAHQEERVGGCQGPQYRHNDECPQ